MELDENKTNSINTDVLEELRPNLEEIIEHQTEEVDLVHNDNDVLYSNNESIFTETIESEIVADNVQEENLPQTFDTYENLFKEIDTLNVESNAEDVLTSEISNDDGEIFDGEVSQTDDVEISDEEIMASAEESLPNTEVTLKEEQMNETSNNESKQTYVETLVVNNLVGGANIGNSPAPVVNVTVEKEKTQPKTYSLDDYVVSESLKGEIVWSKGEELIKEYRIVKNSGRGTVTVTNRRLIIDSNTRVEVPIEKVSGVSSSKYNEVRTVKLIFGILFIGICLGLCLYDFNKVIPEKFMWAIYLLVSVGALFGLIGFLMVCTSFKRKFALSIFTEGLSPIISISSKRRKAEGNLFGTVEIARRGKDFAKFTGEIGALIIHIKDAQNGKL